MNGRFLGRPLVAMFNTVLMGSLFLSGTHVCIAADDESFDIVLRGGTIHDGTGQPGFVADVGVKGEYIVAIGDIGDSSAVTELDVSGLVVAPGFINLHSHATFDGLLRAENMLLQGVTTEMLGPDGGGRFGLVDELESLDAAQGIAINTGAYIGFNAIWKEVVGLEDIPASTLQIQEMREIVIDSLQSGVWGVSAGLDYVPAYYASRQQVIDVVSVAGPWRSNFPNHERLNLPDSDTRPEDVTFSSLFGIQETIEIGTNSNISPVITHMKLQGNERGRGKDAVALLDSAISQGIHVSADVYPYIAGMTGLHSLIIPPWAQSGGREAMLDRFNNPELRESIMQQAVRTMNERFGGAPGVYVVNIQKTLAQVMQEREISAGEALLQTIATEPSRAILTFGTEEDLIRIMRYRNSAISDDGGATTSTDVHPRSYGTFARVLGRYVRDRRVLTWEDAIRKMSGLPATIVGMTNRGFISKGMIADIAIFDPKTVIDHSTFEKPSQLAEGIVHVLLAGQPVVSGGTLTGARAGRVVRRSANEVSRPMMQQTSRVVDLKGSVELKAVSDIPISDKVVVHVDLSQERDARTATGVLQITAPDGSKLLESSEFGLLQTYDGWSTFTGIAVTRFINSLGDVDVQRDVPIRVIIDNASPVEPNGSTIFMIDIGGSRQLTGYLQSEHYSVR